MFYNLIQRHLNENPTTLDDEFDLAPNDNSRTSSAGIILM